MHDPHRMHECFRPVYVFMFLMGCLGFRLKGDALLVTPFTVVYTNVVRVGLVAGFLGGAARKYSNPESYEAMIGRLSPVLRTIMSFECFFSVVTYLQSSIMMERRKHAFIAYAAALQRLDASVVAAFPGVRWNYHKSIRKYTPLSYAVVSYYYLAGLIYVVNLANCWCDVSTTLLIAFSYSSITGAPSCLNAFLLNGQMDFLRLRFRLLQRLCEQRITHATATPTEPRPRSATVPVAVAMPDDQTVPRLIDYYKRYSELIPPLNSIFGYISAASSFYDFFILTCMCFLLCLKASSSALTVGAHGSASVHPAEYIFIVMFMTPRLYKVTVSVGYGYLLQKERRNCFQKMTLCIDRTLAKPQRRATLDGLLGWQMHHTYEITIGRKLPCNLNVAYMILNGIINYVVILIQLQLQQNIIANNLRQHGVPPKAVAQPG